jgi:hypothetical protein
LADKLNYRPAIRQVEVHVDRLTDKQTEGETNRQAKKIDLGGQFKLHTISGSTERQADRLTNRQ